MINEELDHIYGNKFVTIFMIEDYLNKKYGGLVVTSWDCQDWGFWKSLFRRKKTGYEITNIGSTCQMMVTFYDKRRETVEALEEELKDSILLKVYSLLNELEKKYNPFVKDTVEGSVYVRIEEGNLIISLFKDKALRSGENSVYTKLERLFRDKAIEWKTNTGVDMIDLKMPVNDFVTILELMQ